MEQIADRGDDSGAQDVKMQMVPEACLHQLTLEDSPKDCRGNFTRKSTKNLRPGGGLAGLGFCYYIHSAKMCLTNLNLVLLSYTARAIIAEKKPHTSPNMEIRFFHV